jgi:hypothetical protein
LVVERLVEAVLAGELGQAEREPRVRDDLRPVVLELRRCEARTERIALAGLDSVALMQLRQRNPLGGVLRVEVEREPEEVGVELAPSPLGRQLAEPAERSDVVAPDDDRVLGHDRQIRS